MTQEIQHYTTKKKYLKLFIVILTILETILVFDRHFVLVWLHMDKQYCWILYQQ